MTNPTTSKGVTLITEMAEKDVTFLTDLDPIYVSLVKHAANQQPFRIVKADKTVAQEGDTKKGEHKNTATKMKGANMGMIVHSILIPNTVPIEALLATKELAWLGDANLAEKQEFDKYARFEQIPVDKFEKDSLKLTKVHDTGVWVVEGQLARGTQVEKALSIGESPMWQPVAEETTVSSYTTTFGDLFYDELDRFASITSGLMRQVAADPVARKAAILTALEAFTSFLSMSLDAVSNKAVKMERNLNKADGGKKMFAFETKEEFTTAVSEVVKAAITKKEEEGKLAATKATEKAAEEAKKTAEATKETTVAKHESSDQIKALEGIIAEVGKQVRELAEKTEKIGSSLASPPGSTQTIVDAKQGKSPEADKKTSVFSGILR